jgi:hypothetical protein
MTNFWDHCDKQRVRTVTIPLGSISHPDVNQELDEGKLLIDAVKAAGVSRVVWSGLELPSKVSNSKYVNVLHWDDKAEATEYALASGVPLVNVEVEFYAENMVNSAPYRTKEADGTVVIAFPINATAVLPLLDAGNGYGLSSTSYTSTITTIYVAFLGLFVLRALEAEEFPAGTDVCTNSEDITMGEMVQQLADCTSRTPLPINI